MATRINITELRQPYSQVLGWWNKSLPGTTLGTLLIFHAECSLVSRLCNSGAIDIALNAASHGISNVPDGKFRLLESDDSEDAALSILNGIESIGKIYLCGGIRGLQTLSECLNDTHLSWPQANRLEMPSAYDTTQYLQEMWRATGRLKPLTFKTDLRAWACQTIRHTFGNSPVVGLHLKQVIGYVENSPISLANEPVWFEFLTDAASQFDIQFLLIGDDPICADIQALRQVTLARNIGADNFCMHLALLSECAGFMGMMSSICNTALFSDLPYVVFKNPDHHRQEMILEIGSNDHYPFATQYQKIIRENETSTRLLEELRRMPFVIDALPST